ncbi:hypothetical protein FRC01_001320 [Tulasnella sp. 417]|nr:hypothetical protein FRC01_001320 [Tulasnella sp. 417]
MPQPQPPLAHQPPPTSTFASPAPASPLTTQLAKPPVPELHPPPPSDNSPPPRSSHNSMKQTLKLVTKKKGDSTKSTARKAGSTKSRPQTPALSDRDGTPNTSFDKQLKSLQHQASLSHLPPFTPMSTSPVSSSPSKTQASKPPIPPTHPLHLVEHSPTLLISQQEASPPPLGAPIQRTKPSHSEDWTMPGVSRFDPRSSVYQRHQFIHSSLECLNANGPDLSLGIETTPTATELDHGADIDDGQEHDHEENETVVPGAHAILGQGRPSRVLVWKRTLSEASKGALSIFGARRVEDRHQRPRKHLRTVSTPSNVVEVEKERLADLSEELITDDGPGGEGYRPGLVAGGAILTDLVPPNSPLFLRPAMAPPLPASPEYQSTVVLNSPPLSPAPQDALSLRAVSPPLIGFAVPPPTLTTTPRAPSPTDDMTPSIAFPASPPSPSPSRTISSFVPTWIQLTTTLISQSDGLTADSAAATLPDIDRSDALYSNLSQSHQASLTAARAPPLPPVRPEPRPVTAPPSPKLRLSTRSIRSGINAPSSTAWSDQEDFYGATAQAPSVHDARQSLGLSLDGEPEEYHDPQGSQSHSWQIIQHPRMSDLSCTLTPTETGETDTILRSALEDVDLKRLFVQPSRLIIIPNTEIGWGKYGEVVQAVLDSSSQKQVRVAVKELRNRLARELKIWAKVKHPNILPLIGYHLSENYEIAQFISPFMTNGNVTQYFESEKVGLVRRFEITNILINDSLQAVLGDFGLASLMQESDTSSGLTTSRTPKGSLRYMSPELHLEEDARPTLASDVWAWGCTAFEIYLIDS